MSVAIFFVWFGVGGWTWPGMWRGRCNGHPAWRNINVCGVDVAARRGVPLISR